VGDALLSISNATKILPPQPSAFAFAIPRNRAQSLVILHLCLCARSSLEGLSSKREKVDLLLMTHLQEERTVGERNRVALWASGLRDVQRQALEAQAAVAVAAEKAAAAKAYDDEAAAKGKK